MDMTLEEQGAYRNLLDEAHLRGGPLPNDERILAKACGDALAWSRVKTAVMARFELRPDGWRNPTLDGVISKTAQLSKDRSIAGQEGNKARWGNKPVASHIATSIAKPITNASSPDPDPDPYQDPSPDPQKSAVSENKLIRKVDAVTTSTAAAQKPRPINGQSKRPIYRGSRLTVFEWMYDDIGQMLGPALNDFDLDLFFQKLDQSITSENIVLAKTAVWPFIQERVLAEAVHRGLSVAIAPQKMHKRDVRDQEVRERMRSIS